MLFRLLNILVVCLFATASVAEEDIDPFLYEPEESLVFIGTDWTNLSLQDLRVVLAPKLGNYFRVIGIRPIIVPGNHEAVRHCFIIIQEVPIPAWMDDIPFGTDGIQFVEDFDSTFKPAKQITIDVDTCRSPIEVPLIERNRA